MKAVAMLNNIANRYHFAPLDGSVGSRRFYTNLSLLLLNAVLAENVLIKGEPGSGKTTSSKIVLASATGIPYDLYDAVEMRGNPQKYEEKIIGRFHFGKLQGGEELVIWQGTFVLPAIVVDEGNRFSAETQDVLLQGIDTGIWTYGNERVFVGKRPVFLTANHEDDGNGALIPPLNDRMGIMVEQLQVSPVRRPQLRSAKLAVEEDLCSNSEVESALETLSKKGLEAFRTKADEIAKGRLSKFSWFISPTEMQNVRAAIESMAMDNDAELFLQSVMAEINYSAHYGQKRLCDPISDDSHDQQYVGNSTHGSFSARPGMSAERFAKGLAWLLGDASVSREHVHFILPHTFAHKAHFTDDFRNARASDHRADCEELHLAKKLTDNAFTHYTNSILPMKNFIALVQHIGTHGLDELVRLTQEVAARSMGVGAAIGRLTQVVPPIKDGQGNVVPYTQDDVRLLTQVLGSDDQDATAAMSANDHPLMKYMIQDVRDELRGGMK